MVEPTMTRKQLIDRLNEDLAREDQAIIAEILPQEQEHQNGLATALGEDAPDVSAPPRRKNRQ